jgi:4-diphosphocytidyl-2-C-methyl-D-erythritol kinase
MPSILRSYAKINLGLRIGPLQADGFHSLATVYQTIDLWDRISITAEPAAKTEIVIHCDDQRVPRDERNTCWKMAAAALAAMDLNARVEIEIDKRLPVQGGLGAGSANAAATLLGLKSELAVHGISLPLHPERLKLAATVGSDVPLFLLGGASFGTGHGEQVVALADAQPLHCVVAVPDVAVSTPQAFRDWDAISAQETLTPADSADKLNELGRIVAQVWPLAGPSGVFSVGEGLAEDPLLALVQTGIENDFERVAFPQQPLLRDLKSALAGSDSSYNLSVPVADRALYAALSGSGAALFGLYNSPAAAESAAERVRSLGSKALLTSTLGRQRYWREMQGDSR